MHTFRPPHRFWHKLGLIYAGLLCWAAVPLAAARDTTPPPPLPSTAPAASAAALGATAADAKGGGPTHPRDLAAYTIPPPPDWADRYAHADLAADVRYFRIQKLMSDFALSRFAAVEVQSHYRHFTARGVPGAQAFEQALSEVRAGRMGSGVDLAKLRSAPFIVVYDLDETLYQMSYQSGPRGPAWRDFTFDNRGHSAYVKLRPGWKQAIDRIHALGGLVMLFTARADDVAASAISSWRIGDSGIRDHVDGFLSKSHLVLQEKADGDPIAVPSKDLRMFDETLERVIIVDDNPKRIVQHNRQRLIKKFQADAYLGEANGAVAKSPLSASFEQTLPVVIGEIEEALRYLREHSSTRFADAYLPYTLLGRVAMEALTQAGLSETQARLYIRQNPSYVDDSF